MRSMALVDVMHNYRDGDELPDGWQEEFDWLRQEHGERLDALAASVRKVGILEPILLGTDGRVWDGHHRLCVAYDLGLTSVPVTAP